MMYKIYTAAFDGVDDGAALRHGYRWATEAVYHLATAGQFLFVHKLAAMHHNSPLGNQVVDARLHTLKLQRQPIVAFVGLAGKQKTEYAFIAVIYIAETGGHFLPAVFAMRNIGLDEYLFVQQINDIQTLILIALAKIGDAQKVGIGYQPTIEEYHIPFIGFKKNFLFQTSARQLELLVQLGSQLYVGSAHSVFGGIFFRGFPAIAFLFGLSRPSPKAPTKHQ
jgi:hypothetical protein